MTIDSILYNTGKEIQEVPVREVRMEVGDKVQVRGSKLSERPLFAEIVDFPVGMLACNKTYREFADTIESSECKYAMMGDCNHRSPERLPGYIDIHVWSHDGTFNREPY